MPLRENFNFDTDPHIAFALSGTTDRTTNGSVRGNVFSGNAWKVS